MQFSFNKKKIRIIVDSGVCVCIYFFFPTCCPLETLEVIANKNIVMPCKDLLHTRTNEILIHCKKKLKFSLVFF